MNGVRRAQVGWGDAVAVFGLGILGQLAVDSAACVAPGLFLALTLLPSFGAASRGPRNPTIGMHPQVPKRSIQAIAEKTCDRMVDCAFEVTGSPQTIPNAIRTVRRQGRFILLSSPRGKTEFDFTISAIPLVTQLSVPTEAPISSGDPKHSLDPGPPHRILLRPAGGWRIGLFQDGDAPSFLPRSAGHLPDAVGGAYSGKGVGFVWT